MSYRLHKNIYKCPAGHNTITIDLDDGVTPFKLTCTHAGCRQLATSSWHLVDQSLHPTHGFYVPTAAELSTLNRMERTHVARGGLLFRSLNEEERRQYAARQFD